MNAFRKQAAKLGLVLSVAAAALPISNAQDLAAADKGREDSWELARQRAGIFEDCGRNAARLLQAWLDNKRDPQTGLFSRGRTWDYHNEAADHYSSLVLMAFCVRPETIAVGGPLHETLCSSQRLCASASGIPTLYDLKTRSQGPPATLGALAEWARDGLVRIVELMGTDNDWYREYERLTDAMLAEARRRGGLTAAFRGDEPAGNMLQSLARLYAFSGKEKYLAAAETLGDHYLLGEAQAVGAVRYMDHGCELVPGLAELFALECQLKRPRAAAYAEPLRRLLDGLLESDAHPETGLLAGWTAGPDGQRRWKQPPDTWGYVFFAYENYDRATGQRRYAATLEKPLRWLIDNRGRFAELKESRWPNTSHNIDDWSDSYESMIVLANRFPHLAGVFPWLDWATRQDAHRRELKSGCGPYTGGHFDGSTGRTLCLHMMLCSQGARALPFVEGLRLGAIRRGDVLDLWLVCHKPWSGKLCFDGPRTEHRGARIDWARINEMPQWHVVRPELRYGVARDQGDPQPLYGRELIQGMPMTVEAGRPTKIRLRLMSFHRQDR